MTCISPTIDLPNLILTEASSLNVSTGFIMDGVTDLLTWCVDGGDCRPLEYFQNPEYYSFNDPIYSYADGIGVKDGDTMIIRVS